MRPATRKFRRELDLKVARLRTRIGEADAGKLTEGQNPGFDRLAECLFLKGEWEESKALAGRAVGHWKAALDGTKAEPQKCEPAFHWASALLFADDMEAARAAFAEGVRLFAGNGLSGSDDTGYMAVACGDLRRAEVVFHAAVVADMGAQGMSDLKRFAERFPDTPRLLKMQFAQGLAKGDGELVGKMALMERWLTPEPEGVTSFRTEEWFFAAHQAVLAQLARGEKPRFRLYDEDVVRGLSEKRA
jgi:hypothetical protein